ncbi:hypothetical protein RHDC4_02368 [Rhodocyclaceae bacterium]|nr:hypothetical protein RHDC4_02368 [Rhodocyclaceae bacterium]
MATVRDFTDAETKLVGQALNERYGQAIPLQFADAEIQLIAESSELTTCPIVYWEARGANFVIFKLGDDRYRAQFYYSDVEQFGTGKEIFNNLGDCVITLLQVQSDHERTRAGIKSGMNAYTIGNPDDYDGPLVV